MNEPKPVANVEVEKHDTGPLGRLVDEKVNRPETPADVPAQPESPPQPRATSDYAEGTAEHDDDREV